MALSTPYYPTLSQYYPVGVQAGPLTGLGGGVDSAPGYFGGANPYTSEPAQVSGVASGAASATPTAPAAPAANPAAATNLNALMAALVAAQGKGAQITTNLANPPATTTKAATTTTPATTTKTPSNPLSTTPYYPTKTPAPTVPVGVPSAESTVAQSIDGVPIDQYMINVPQGPITPTGNTIANDSGEFGVTGATTNAGVPVNKNGQAMIPVPGLNGKTSWIPLGGPSGPYTVQETINGVQQPSQTVGGPSGTDWTISPSQFSSLLPGVKNPFLNS